MPTGYTADIEKGISFNEYALTCARAFGALIMMRDEPANAQIPDKFEPSSYEVKHLAELKEELKRTKSLTTEQCDKESKEEFERERLNYTEGITKAAELLTKYNTMLEAVEEWTPPSDDHIELKKFMKSQIEDSIKFDCTVDFYTGSLKKLTRKTGEQWLKQKLNSLEENIVAYSRYASEELERTNNRNRWVRQLRESLKTEGK